MQEQVKESTRLSYNRISAWYDLISYPFEKKLKKKGVALVDPAPGEHILEIGFATGHELLDFARRVGINGKVTGIDLSEKMIRIAQKRAVKTGFQSRITLIHGDAETTLLPDESADAVYLSFSLELFSDQGMVQVLRNCYRMLKPAGRVVVVCLSRRKVNLMVRMYEYLHRKFPQAIDCRPVLAPALLTGAGFTLTKKTEYVLYGLPVDLVMAVK
jgi:ubiquinone/menaquinone biosynthesis C-methylase UbiE